MAYKILKYLLDDTVNVINPRYSISISVDGILIEELGCHVIIKDDLIPAAVRALKENKIKAGNCKISISETCEDLTYEMLVSFAFKEDKLKPV